MVLVVLVGLVFFVSDNMLNLVFWGKGVLAMGKRKGCGGGGKK